MLKPESLKDKNKKINGHRKRKLSVSVLHKNKIMQSSGRRLQKN